MTVELYHNKIVKDTATEQFELSVIEVLLPKLREIYGEGLSHAVMYEDYIADKLEFDGRWYYPLTLIVDGAAFTEWVSWSLLPKKLFATSSPYSYVGKEPLAFEITSVIPEGFEEKIRGRKKEIPTDAIRLKVHAATTDSLLLAGKYSQSFVDELAEQITARLSSLLGVTGLKESNIELQMVFAPGTYMEHTSENRTYRRLLITDKGCQARDFWVKWTRLDSAAGYSVCDHVSKETIVFDLGEDVPQKIREKEFRFLCASNPDRYQSAMGKKTVTEWRDIIKRALKRGDLVKTPDEFEVSRESEKINAQLEELLSERTIENTHAAQEVNEDYGSFASVMDMARATLAALEEREGRRTEPAFEEADEVLETEAESISEEIEAYAEEAEENEAYATPEGEEAEVYFDTDEELDSEGAEDEEASVVSEAEGDEEREAPEPLAELPEEVSLEGDISEIPEDIDYPIDADKRAREEFAREAEALLRIEAEESKKREAEEKAKREAEEKERLEAMRATIEAQVRLEYESHLRVEAEKQADALRLEREALKAENERLMAEAKRNAEALESQRSIDEQTLRALEEKEQLEREAERLRRDIAARNRLEAEERDRLAEAAKIAVEEQRRREALDAEREEFLRAAAEARRIEAEARMAEEERRLEADRIRREAEAARQREAEAARIKAEQSSPTYLTKRAKLIFRKPVDVNVIKQIKEIVERTLITEGKENVRLHMKAYLQDTTTINLDILRIPSNEKELLVSIIKAIGNGGLGISKITLE